VHEVNGDKQVQSLTLFNKKTNQESNLPVDGVFIYVGIVPNNALIKNLLELDNQGSAKTDEDMQTKIPGFYVAGDVRQKNLRQVVTAASDGAIAGFFAEKYISETGI
jgi:thioredoxin reductase (NADPH)